MCRCDDVTLHLISSLHGTRNSFSQKSLELITKNPLLHDRLNIQVNANVQVAYILDKSVQCQCFCITNCHQLMLYAFHLNFSLYLLSSKSSFLEHDVYRGTQRSRLWKCEVVKAANDRIDCKTSWICWTCLLHNIQFLWSGDSSSGSTT
jgi:hypothetical protein